MSLPNLQDINIFSISLLAFNYAFDKKTKYNNNNNNNHHFRFCACAKSLWVPPTIKNTAHKILCIVYKFKQLLSRLWHHPNDVWIIPIRMVCMWKIYVLYFNFPLCCFHIKAYNYQGIVHGLYHSIIVKIWWVTLWGWT